MSDLRIGIIGAGSITKEHLKVIESLDSTMICGITSRTISRAENLALEFSNLSVFNTTLELVEKGKADALLVLVSADQIFSVVEELLPIGLPLFIEKPPGLSSKETSILADHAELCGTANMVGFNRRYYSIFRKGLEIIERHGKLLGVVIEGHERFWKVKGKVDEIVREHWLYANSIHTIDLLRFFGGEPRIVHALASSHLEKNSDQFSTVLSFESGTLGNYSSHWYSPGGWSVRLFGDGVTVEFKPLEEAHWLDTNLKIHEIEADNEDIIYKPGFFRQMASFVKLACGEPLQWPAQDLRGAQKTMELTSKISGA